MNTIDLFREIMQKDPQEYRGVCLEREGESPGLSGHRERNRIAKPEKVLDPTSGPEFVEKSQNVRRILMALKVIFRKEGC